jgi:hypothetical protein
VVVSCNDRDRAHGVGSRSVAEVVSTDASRSRSSGQSNSTRQCYGHFVWRQARPRVHWHTATAATSPRSLGRHRHASVAEQRQWIDCVTMRRTPGLARSRARRLTLWVPKTPSCAMSCRFSGSAEPWGTGKPGSPIVLLRLAYLALTGIVTFLRLLPMSSTDKNI